MMGTRLTLTLFPSLSCLLGRPCPPADGGAAGGGGGGGGAAAFGPWWWLGLVLLSIAGAIA